MYIFFHITPGLLLLLLLLLDCYIITVISNTINIIIVTRNGKIVWKHGPNQPFYALMLRTKLYQNLFFFTGHQNVNKLKSRAARTAYGSTFLPFYKIIVSFFLFSVKMQSKQDQTVLQQVAICQRNTLYKTQNGEPDYVVYNFSLAFARSYLFKNLGTDIQTLQSWLVGWCMYCVTLRLHDIKKLQCPLNTP